MTEADSRATLVAEAFERRELLEEAFHREAVLSTLADLDLGRLRAATKGEDGTWTVHAWVQQAVLLYFAIAPMEEQAAGPLHYHDRVPNKKGFVEAGVRVVPGAVVRYGSFLERGCVVMPGFVNIGAYVGEGTMVDTWATVGSCAQVGKRVHLAGGVGLGGVLEPPGSRPVIIGDDCFIGSRCIVVEGVEVGDGAVLGANVCLTSSTPIIDVREAEPRTLFGKVPPGAVVIPGARKKVFPAGSYEIPCALIVKERSGSTEEKTALNETLRGFAL